MTKEINKLRKRIFSVSKDTRRRDIFVLARDLEDCTLEIEAISNEIFSLYVEIFSCPLLCAKSGVDEFARGIFNDFYKLSSEQRDRLLESFVVSAALYSDSTLRLAIGDLIARKYSSHDALGAFRRMWASGERYSRNVAQFGADVLFLVLPKDGPERNDLGKFELEIERDEQ
ncbi:hypothetical protein [Burkholderia cepacia]|uniref:hypothetical protein n=1 Tax=Burkholderia cepacia TaxID=292 RepID=UPI000F5B0446|nr:hypothetical protein [Burkholderia cepacia]